MKKLGTHLVAGIIIFFLVNYGAILVAGDAILTWSPNTDPVMGYKVYYGTASRTYGSPTDVGNQTTYTVTGLGTGTYYFAVTAYNSGGMESGFSQEVSKTIVSADTTAPSTPTGLTATAVNSTQINLSWTASTDSVGVTGYRIYRNGTQIATSAGTTYQNTGLSPSTTYSYTVSAYDAAGNNSAQSTAASATTQAPPDVTAPSVPASLTATSISSTQINLSWTASTDSVGVTGYRIYRNGTQIATSAGTTYQNTGLSPSTTYSYTVSAYDAAGNNSAQSTAASATTQAPPDTAPPVISGVAIASITSSGATVQWSTNEAADSQVEYGTTAAYGSFTTVDTSQVLAHSQAVSGLTSGTVYHYRVKSRDAAGNLAISGDMTFITMSRCDVNADGNINALDLQMVINAILAGSNLVNLDINRDSRVDVLDLQILNNVILGVTTCPTS